METEDAVANGMKHAFDLMVTPLMKGKTRLTLTEQFQYGRPSG
jgi:hypothetical protein